MSRADKDLLSIQEARILVENARNAQFLVKDYKQSYLDKIINQLLENITMELAHFIDMEVNETKRGSIKDKEWLLTHFLSQLEKELSNQQCIGELLKDSAGNILKVGVPLGVIVVFPSENNVILNTLYSIVIGIKSGNSIIVIPDNEAYHTTIHVVNSVKNICEKYGLPVGCITCLESISESGILEIVTHKNTSMIISAGKINNTTNTQKPIIYGGTGGTPAFIEHTANVSDAVQSVIDSRSLDNGMLPGSEQYLIVEQSIASEVKQQLQQKGAHFLSEEEEHQLLNLLQPKDNGINPICVGKNAYELAELAHFSIEDNTSVLVSEKHYVHELDPFVNEMKCPVIAFYLEPDWMHACEKSIRLLKEKNNGHTIAIHSNNLEVLNQFALKKPVGRMIVNSPSSLASMGINSTLATSCLLGGLTTGKGISAKNITASDLTYIREISHSTQCIEHVNNVDEESHEKMLEEILRKILA
ncbi:aldehyde dehydrogenase family protein [Vagococcus luciliae]|uniref:Aldehyde-alcohol dehydrogenase n=1 Tax=Vagococcus luciliae TaxID=2920380 RepID=A0ABY5NWR1_9ENTE|nr:aldehyde dehydrogenase family protein [Vagococcus luciliae]UUV98086.1 Aldehyde-alcohol dehydrogenase [Vagococcus luciliae]